MKTYSEKIALVKNSRGIYILDTTMGCASGMANERGGCYNDCYAARSAKTYGFDFTKTVLRKFENEKHRRQIVNEINRIPLDFVRIGGSGDPSENWEHTVSIISKIKNCNKQIVVITKHWTNLTEQHLKFFGEINICINTSVSALDKPALLQNSLLQYERLKPYCKSILRIVINEIVNVKQGVFNGHKALMSKMNKKTFTGKCSVCREMCGINIKVQEQLYPAKPGISKQQKLFDKLNKPILQ